MKKYRNHGHFAKKGELLRPYKYLEHKEIICLYKCMVFTDGITEVKLIRPTGNHGPCAGENTELYRHGLEVIGPQICKIPGKDMSQNSFTSIYLVFSSSVRIHNKIEDCL